MSMTGLIFGTKGLLIFIDLRKYEILLSSKQIVEIPNMESFVFIAAMVEIMEK